MKKAYEDDSEMTEIIIQPDGRVYVFGLSEAVAEALKPLRLESLREAEEIGGGNAGEGAETSEDLVVVTHLGETREQH